MTETPSISLLVPIYNVEKYLRECLDSARNQTLKNIEVICINDGSTDGSRDIIQEYLDADPRFRVIDKPNSGYGVSMNMGLEAARGEYIGILESDDFLDPDGLRTLYEAAKRYDAPVVKSDFYLFWSKPKYRNVPFRWTDETLSGVINPQIEREVFYRKPSIWSAIYKRSFLKQNDINFLETPGASYQDAGFNFKVWASCSKAVLVNKQFLHYRQDNEKSSVNSPGKVFCVRDEYNEMNRWLDAHPNKGSYLRQVLVKMQFDSYMWNYGRLSPELRREFFPEMHKTFAEQDAKGLTDYNLFEPWKVRQRKMIINDPKIFELVNAKAQAQVTTADGSTVAYGDLPQAPMSQLQKVQYYLKHGGPEAVLKMAYYKLAF